MGSCCTCASILSSVPLYASAEKPLPDSRIVPCCSRIICGRCIHKNPRFSSYCPFCQVSTGPPSHLEPRPLPQPPAYNPTVPQSAGQSPTQKAADEPAEVDPPPPYTPHAPASSSIVSAPTDTKHEEVAIGEPPPEDTLHFLDHEHDTIPSLSLRYAVPAEALRRANNLASDHLLPARRTVVVPGAYYRAGVSLSPRPVGGEEEMHKARIRRFMVTCKVAEYDAALFYLEQSRYDLSAAVEKYLDDERWEREHPMNCSGEDRSSKGKGRGRSRPGRLWGLFTSNSEPS